MLKTNLFCNKADLNNESSVEIFFVNRILGFLGYSDSDIKTKQSINELEIGKGSKKEKYKPDYICFVDNKPSLIIDAKSPDENIEDYFYQVSGYALAVNQKFREDNPVRYVVLSNGLKTNLYNWDDQEPLLSLGFDDFEKNNEKLKKFKDIVSYQGIFNQRIPEVEDFEFYKPPIDSIKDVFAKAHNIIWKKEKIAPTDAFYEFSKIIFIKIDQDRKIRELRQNGKTLKKDDFVFSSHWIANQEPVEPNSFNTILFHQLRDKLEEEITERKKKRIFEKDENLNLKPSTTKEVVKLLEHLDLYGIDEDLNGRMFETFLNATVRGKDLGQFFTPRGVVKFMVKLADIKISSKKIERIIDIFCGSGGFLIEAMAEMMAKIRELKNLSNKEAEKLVNDIKSNYIFGIDANPKISKVARMNMYLHGDGGSRIYQTDSLDKKIRIEQGINPELRKEIEEIKQLLLHDGLKFDVALTNPPFSMKYERKKPDEKEILEEYEISENENSVKSNVLSLERYRGLLDDNSGRLLSIIDDTVLNGVSSKIFRDAIRKKFVIKAIISLPFNTFKNASTTTKTSILYLRKKVSATEKQPAVFMAICNNVGHNDFGNDMPERNNLNQVLFAYREFIEKGKLETQVIQNQRKTEMLTCPLQIFIVQQEELKERFDAFYYSPELKIIQHKLNKFARNGKIELKTGNDLVLKPDLPASKVRDLDSKIFKYLEVGDVNNRGDIVGYQENQLKNLPTRARKMVATEDVIVAKNISSLGSVAIINENFNGYLVSTGFIVIKPKNRDDAYLLWSILKSDLIQKQMYYLSATAVQPEVSEEIFKTELLIPIPTGSKEKAEIIKTVENIEKQRRAVNSAIDTQDKALMDFLDFK